MSLFFLNISSLSFAFPCDFLIVHYYLICEFFTYELSLPDVWLALQRLLLAFL